MNVYNCDDRMVFSIKTFCVSKTYLQKEQIAVTNGEHRIIERFEACTIFIKYILLCTLEISLQCITNSAMTRITSTP